MRIPPWAALACSLLCIAGRAVAGIGHWTPMGPSAAGVERIFVDSGDPLFVYASSGYRSPDYNGNPLYVGYVWAPVALAEGKSVSPLSASPTRSGRVYAGACAQNDANIGVCRYFRSDDFGATWTFFYSTPGNVVLVGIAEARTAPSRLYAAGSLYGHAGPAAFFQTSSDGGATWTGPGITRLDPSCRSIWPLARSARSSWTR